MPDEIKRFIEASDNASDYADAQIESIQLDALEDVDDLFRNPDNRDPELWDAIGVDEALTISDYEAVKPAERGLDWVTGFAGISAAASTQVFIANKERGIINPVAYREQVLDGFTLTREQLVLAGKRGVELEATKRFVAIQAKYKAEMAFLADLTGAEVYRALLEYDAILPAEQLISNATGYVARMTNYPPGSLQFKEEVSKLVDKSAGDNLRQMNRRAIERIHSYREANGDGNTLMVWLTEGGPSTCSYCLEMGGTVATYEWFITNGMPGADVCKGGDRCRCHLAQA